MLRGNHEISAAQGKEFKANFAWLKSLAYPSLDAIIQSGFYSFLQWIVESEGNGYVEEMGLKEEAGVLLVEYDEIITAAMQAHGPIQEEPVRQGPGSRELYGLYYLKAKDNVPE